LDTLACLFIRLQRCINIYKSSWQTALSFAHGKFYRNSFAEDIGAKVVPCWVSRKGRAKLPA